MMKTKRSKARVLIWMLAVAVMGLLVMHRTGVVAAAGDGATPTPPPGPADPAEMWAGGASVTPEAAPPPNTNEHIPQSFFGALGDTVKQGASAVTDLASGLGSAVQNVVFHFSYHELVDALNQALVQGSMDALDHATRPIQDQASKVFVLWAAYTSDGLAHFGSNGTDFLTATRQLWRLLRNIALAFIPLVFLTNLLAYYTGGEMGPRAYVDVLVQTALTVVAILASLYVGHWVIRLGWGTAHLILSSKIAVGGGTVSPATGPVALLKQMGATVITGIVGGLVGFIINPLIGAGIGIIAFYLIMFLLFLLIMAIVAIGWANVTVVAITILVLAMAPIAIVLGSLPGFRWIYGMWIKVLVGMALYPVLSAILLQVWAVLAKVGGFIHGFESLVHFAMIGLLIGINGWLAKVSATALMDAGKRAWGATTGLAKLAIGGIILASGGGLGGLVGGVGGISGVLGGSGGGMSGAAATGGLAATSSASSSAPSAASGAARGGLLGRITGRFQRNLASVSSLTAPLANMPASDRLMLAGQFLPGGLGRLSRGAGIAMRHQEAAESVKLAHQAKTGSENLSRRLQEVGLPKELRRAVTKNASDVHYAVQSNVPLHQMPKFQNFLQQNGMDMNTLIEQGALARTRLSLDAHREFQKHIPTLQAMRQESIQQIESLAEKAQGTGFEQVFTRILGGE